MDIYKYDIEFNDNMLPSLVRDGLVGYDCRSSLTAPGKITEFLANEMRFCKKTEEHAIVIALNVRCRPIAVFDVSHGTSDATMINPREIMQRLLLSGANSWIVAHNHPSGDVTPSRIDITSTEDLAKAADFMKIPLIDHIIIAPNGAYYSFYESNNVLGGKDDD